MNGSLAVTTWKPGTNTWQKGRWKWKVKVLITQSCLTFCNPMARLLDPWNSPARILEWVAIPSPRNLLDPGIKPRSPALQADSWLSEQPGKPNEEYTEVFLRKTCRTMESKSSTVINLHELEQCFLTSGCGLGAFFQLRISTGSPLPRFCLLGHLQVASLGFPIWEIANIVFLSPTFWNSWKELYQIYSCPKHITGTSQVAQLSRIHLQCRRHRSDPWVRKIPWRRKWQPTPLLLPGKSQGQRRLAGYSPRGHKELNKTEWLKQQRMSWLLISILNKLAGVFKCSDFYFYFSFWQNKVPWRYTWSRKMDRRPPIGQITKLKYT